MERKIPPVITKGFEYATHRRKLLIGIAQLLFGLLGALFFGVAIIGFVAGPDRSPEHIPSLLFTIGLLLLWVLLIRRGRRNLCDYRTGRGWAGEDKQLPPAVEAKPSSATVGVAASVTVSDTQRWGGEAAPTVDIGTGSKVKCESCGAVVAPDEDGRCEYCGTRLTP